MTDDALDRLLRDWAVRHALPNGKADAIRRAVIAAPQVMVERLPAGWWRGFAVTLATTLRDATYIAPSTWRPAANTARGSGGEIERAQARSVST